MFSRKNIILALNIAGIAISSYLAYAKLTSSSIVCGLSGGCDKVQSSSYSTLLGIPLGIWGMGFFFTMFTAFYMDLKALYKNILVIWGLIFSAYLIFVEAFVIEAWCKWCLGSATVVVLIALLHFTIPSEKEVKL